MSMQRSSAPSTARRVVALAWTIALASLVLVVLVTPAAGAAGSASQRAATFVLVGQTEWVVAPSGAPAGSAPPPASFDLVLSARHAPADALVDVVLYPRLLSRYDFANAVRRGPRGYPLSSTAPAALTQLPPDPHAPGAVLVDLSVVQGAASTQGLRLGLACAPPTGSGTCTGVYPVVVELRQAGGGVLHRFTTFLTYVAGASAHPLELAWVVPVVAPISLAPHPSGLAQAIEPLSAHEAQALEILISQLRAAPSVPLSIEASPQTLQALERAGAGEPTETVAQMAAGATVLHHLHVVTTATPSPWIQDGIVGNDIAGGLAQVHATQLVLPQGDLAPTPNATSSGTWASTFSLTLSEGGTSASVQAAETDTWLDGQFTALPHDPALAATQLLADLAMVHFERPNTVAVRGLVAVPPQRWLANPVFDQVLLAGLTHNPTVEPVTLSHFFSTVTPAGPRQLARPGPGPVIARAQARALSRARLRLTSFDGAVTGRPPQVEAGLDDLLLASETEALSASLRARGVSTVERLLDKQLHLVKFATETTYTLTARTGVIPITVVSGAKYTVLGRLSVSGNKFLFPHHGTRRIIRIDHATNASRVDVEARSSGDLPLHVTRTSPDGRLVFARTLLTVRSTATSLVGIVLTAVALAILLAWWARTWWSGRRRRRSGHARTPGPGRAAA
ncbi:MAG: hypothetical protein M0010_04495 [Actinomycetota bacterium]|nr:hypothetical protein [Actinomycetota bacterium]